MSYLISNTSGLQNPEKIMNQSLSQEKNFKSRLSLPQVWFFLFIFFAALPMMIYYKSYSVYLEDESFGNRSANEKYYYRELVAFANRTTNKQVFLQNLRLFNDTFRRNLPDNTKNSELLDSLKNEIPTNSSIIFWDNQVRVIPDFTSIKAQGITHEKAQGLVEMLIDSYNDFAAGTNLQTLHQIKIFEKQNAGFFIETAPLTGRNFPVSQAFTSPNTILGGYNSSSEVFFYWNFINSKDNSQGGFMVFIPIQNLSPTFSLSKIIKQETESSPEFSVGFFDQGSGHIELASQELTPIAQGLFNNFDAGLENPMHVDDWVIFVQPHPDSSSTDIFSLFSTKSESQYLESNIQTARLMTWIILFAAAMLFYHYYSVTLSKGLSLRKKMAALFFLCMQLPVSILIFLGISYSLTQEKLLSQKAESKLVELVKNIDASTLAYYRQINGWLRSIKMLPEMQNFDKARLHETFFEFSKAYHLTSYYLIGLDGTIEFDIDNMTNADKANNRIFIKELGMRLLAMSSESNAGKVQPQPALSEGLFELITSQTGKLKEIFLPGTGNSELFFSDIVTTRAGKRFASIATIDKTELDRSYLRQSITSQFKFNPDYELIIINQDDFSDVMPKLSPTFKANLLPMIASAKISNSVDSARINDQNGTALVALTKGINTKDFLIGARMNWNKITGEIQKTYILVAIGLFFSLGTSIFLITLLIKEFLLPVSILSSGARAISNGDLNQTLPVFAKDELGDLSSTFNFMTMRLKNRLTELTVLYNLTQKASTSHSQREVFDLAATNLQTHLKAELSGTAWINEGEESLYLAEHLDEKEADAIKACSRAALASFKMQLESCESLNKKIMALPLFFEDKKFGTIYLIFPEDRFKDAKSFSEDENSFIETLRHHLSLIIEKQRLFEQAITDGLTRLYLRRFFLASLEKEISRSKRYQLEVSVLLLDIDLFKRFNDTYGHQAGDHVLRETAQRIIESIRSVDTPGRYGGEEMAVLLPQTGIKEAYLVAERIRKSVEGAEYLFKNDSMRVTVSIGVTTLHLRDVTLEEMIEEADKALYVAKGKGRNQVRIAPEAM